MAQHDEQPSQMRVGEQSFTLIETVIALGLLATVILQVADLQGNAVNLSDYARKVTQATWLAKAAVAEVEYRSTFYPLKEMKTDPTFRNRPIPEEMCPKNLPDCDYTFSVTIEDFKLPIVDVLLGAKQKQDDQNSTGGFSGFGDLVQQKIKEIMGSDSILKTANVEVFWPEGARQNSTNVVYLLTGQRSLDPFIELLPAPPSPTPSPTPPSSKTTGGSP